MYALGRLFDIAPEIAPYDTNAGAGTGLRVSLRNCDNVVFVYFKGAGSGTDVTVLTLQEHNASTGGTSQNLSKITTVYSKTATTLANSETWTKTTQAAAATFTNTGDATKQGLYVIEVSADDLSDGFGWVSLSAGDTGSAGAQYGAILAITSDLAVKRAPANLVNLLNG